MKFLCRALCVFCLALGVVRAAEEEDPESFGDYMPTLDDDLIQYVPKFTVRLGFRAISGVKSGFGAGGLLSSGTLPELTGDISRDYHDGYVNKDTRTYTDPSGRTVPIVPDGRTNTWAFASNTQVVSGGLIAMHNYSAQVNDASIHERDASGSFGVELSLDRDFGKVLNTRVSWGVVAGMSINQFNMSANAASSAEITTTTDYYSLGGQIPPNAPYTAPQFSGTSDISILLGNLPLHRATTVTTSTSAVLTNWQLRGAFLTFRAGPTLTIPFGSRITANLSAGAVIVYSGSTYDIVQTFKPETGDNIVQSVGDGESALLPGFYVDANVQWDMTETAGLYVGGVYQASGDYDQTVTTADGKSAYNTRVDLSKLQGFRAGVSFKF